MKTTIRKVLERQKKTTSILTFSGMAAFILGCIVTRHPIGNIVGMIGFAVGFFTTVYSSIATKCPQCKENLFQLITSSGGSPFSISDKMKACPFCRTEFDAPFNMGRSN